MLDQLGLQPKPDFAGIAGLSAWPCLAIGAGGNAHRAFEGFDDLQQKNLVCWHIQAQPTMRAGGSLDQAALD